MISPEQMEEKKELKNKRRCRTEEEELKEKANEGGKI